MPKISITNFKGLIPKLAIKNLPEETAQVAENVDLLSKRFEVHQEPLQVQGSPGDETIFLWRRDGTPTFIGWDDDVDVVRGPLKDDTFDRIFYTGDSSTEGSTTANALKFRAFDSAEVIRDVGITAPAAPVAVLARLLDAGLVTAQQKITTKANAVVGASTTIDGELKSFEFSDDGRLTLEYTFGETLGPVLNVGLVSFVNFVHITQPRLTIPAGAGGTGTGSAGNIPVAFGGSLSATTVDLVDPATTEVYATFQVESYRWINRNVTWAAIGTTAFQATISGHTLRFVIRFNYVDSDIDTKRIYYVQTVVDEFGQESPASVVSNIVSKEPGESVTLTLPTAAPSGGTRRVYRSAAGNEEDGFFFLLDGAEAAGGTVIDTLRDSELSEALPLLENPQNDMKGLVMMAGGFMAAFKGKEVFFSEPFRPYTWPSEYQMTFPDDIVALAVSGNDLIVMTIGNPWYVQGTLPERMTQTKLMLNQSCVAKKGVAEVGTVIVYPSPDGLVFIVGGEGRLATEPYYDEKTWRTLTPSSFIGEVHDKRYFGVSDGGTIIFDIDEELSALTTTTEAPTVLYSDVEDDTLYIVKANNIFSWAKGADALLGKWKSKPFTFSKVFDLKVGRVIADSYPVGGDAIILRIYAEEVLVTSITVTSAAAFQIPHLRPERVWSFQLESIVGVDEVSLATSMGLLR